MKETYVVGSLGKMNHSVSVSWFIANNASIYTVRLVDGLEGCIKRHLPFFSRKRFCHLLRERSFFRVITFKP